jgi:hypothetical protein
MYNIGLKLPDLSYQRTSILQIPHPPLSFNEKVLHNATGFNELIGLFANERTSLSTISATYH